MPAIRSFRDLEVYQMARREARRIFMLSQRFPPGERYSLTDQIRRSSRSCGSQIAEAWGKRRYVASFVSKVTDALAESMETQSWLDYALDCGYISPEEHESHDMPWQMIGGKLNRMIDRAESFCPPST